MKSVMKAIVVASIVSLTAAAPSVASASQAINGVKPVQYYDRDFRGEHGPRADRWVYHRVREALRRELGRDAENIRVDVRNGNVYLSGVVDSRNEKRAARDAAQSVPGVGEVYARDLRPVYSGNDDRVFGYFPFMR